MLREMLPVTSVKVDPPSRLTWRFPSSVPTQMTPGWLGDSASVVVCPGADWPSFLEAMGSVPGTPMMLN